MMRALLRRRLIRASPGQLATGDLDVVLTDPVSNRERLQELLRMIRLDAEDEVIAAARQVLARVHAADTGGRYFVGLSDAKGVQVGDGNTQTNNFS
jgi:hypothetical protein